MYADKGARIIAISFALAKWVSTILGLNLVTKILRSGISKPNQQISAASMSAGALDIDTMVQEQETCHDPVLWEIYHKEAERSGVPIRLDNCCDTAPSALLARLLRTCLRRQHLIGECCKLRNRYTEEGDISSARFRRLKCSVPMISDVGRRVDDDLNIM
ncbi:hypothetical protein F5B18DRAFT_145802 [Nemania serpens]|nr:hypothetical protein F5B18DRAFT_145802 [Nemania serpens]